MTKFHFIVHLRKHIKYNKFGKTGTGGLADINQPVCTSQQLALKMEHSNMLTDDVFIGCLHMEHVVLNDWQLKILYNLSVVQGPEQDCYWYHSDHIGSTAWVSGVTGTGIAHRGYLSFGEPFVTQQLPGAWNPRYTFSGKERDEETGYSYFGARYYHSDLSIWLSVDPMADKYPNLSPYVYCANNPVVLKDPNGKSFSEFDENGNYLRTIKDNWWHNFWHGRTGRIVDGEGNVIQSFKFADPKHDVADLKNGIINKIHFVQEGEIKNMLSKAGAFDKENKVSNVNSRYGYIKKEGVGLGKFDFSYTGIPNQYPEASSDPINQPSSMLFLVDGVAHNHMNFGNFLFGAAGKALGLTSFELRMGAHWNSLTNPLSNGYRSQFDSRDDQFSIRMGVSHAKQQGYNDMYYRVIVGPLMTKDFGN